MNSQGMDIRQWAVLLVTAALFGSSFFFIKVAVDNIPPVTLAAGRAVLAAIVVYGFLRCRGERFPNLGVGWIPLGALGLMTAAVPYIAVAWGQEHIASSLGGILFATIPVFSVLVAPHLLWEERFTLERLLGAVTGFSGVVLIIGPQALAGLHTQVLGAAVTLLAAVSYAVGAIYARRQTQLTPTVLAGGQLVTACFILVPLSGLIDRPWVLAPTTDALASLALVAIVSTAVPVLLMFWLVRNAGATNASLLAFFMPISAVVLGVGVLGEGLSWSAIAGFDLIIGGAMIVTGNIIVRKPRRA